MTLLEIFLVAVGLAMDAFGVAIGKGLMLTEGESYKKFVLSFYLAFFNLSCPSSDGLWDHNLLISSLNLITGLSLFCLAI